MSTTNWERIRARSFDGRYLFGSAEAILDDADWSRTFRADADEHGADIEVVDGYVYVVFRSEHNDCTGLPKPPDEVEEHEPDHDCFDNAVPYESDGALGHGFECGICGRFLQAG